MKKDRKVYAIDLDWTLCLWEFRWEGEPTPILERIEKVNKLYTSWHIVLIYTARDPDYFRATYAWLVKHWVKHHGINMSRKPWADIYIDDRRIYANTFFKDDINTLDYE